MSALLQDREYKVHSSVCVIVNAITMSPFENIGK